MGGCPLRWGMKYHVEVTTRREGNRFIIHGLGGFFLVREIQEWAAENDMKVAEGVHVAVDDGLYTVSFEREEDTLLAALKFHGRTHATIGK